MSDSKFPRILMFVPQYPYPVVGGLERQSHELSKALIDFGVQVRVLSGKVYSQQASIEYVDGILVNRIGRPKLRLLRYLWQPLTVAFSLWFLRKSFDVIHFHQHSFISLYAICISHLIGKPMITKLPNVGIYGIPGLQKQFLGSLRLKILLSSSAIVAMTEESKRELLRVNYPLNKILTVPNGVTINYGCDVDSKLKVETCRVVTVGRLAPQKQLDVLLHAWARVKENPLTKGLLEIWGEGPLEFELRKLCEELKITDSVSFAGYVADVSHRLREMDIFVLTSMNEGNSNAILEAMCAGLPIVATDVAGAPMQVGYAFRNLLFNIGDIDGLADRLLKLINEYDLRVASGKAMRDRIEREFDIKKIAQKYLCAYRILSDNGNVDISSCSSFPN